MNASGKSALHAAALSQRVIARVGMGDHTVVGDLMFLCAWDAGLVPWLSSALRMRQISRANPIVTAWDGTDSFELPG